MRFNTFCKLATAVLMAAACHLYSATNGLAQGAAGAGGAGGAGGGAGSGAIGGAGVGGAGMGGGNVGGGAVGGGGVGGGSVGVGALGGAAGGTASGTISGAGPGNLNSGAFGVGGAGAMPGVHEGTMLPGPRGNMFEQSPGVNGGVGTIPGRGIRGSGRTGLGRSPPGGGGRMGRGVGPVPKGGDPNPAETLLKDMEGTHQGRRTGHPALKPPAKYRRSNHGLSSDPPALAPQRIEEQAVYFAKRGAYEDMVYRPYQGSYRKMSSARWARNASANRRGG